MLFTFCSLVPSSGQGVPPECEDVDLKRLLAGEANMGRWREVLEAGEVIL